MAAMILSKERTNLHWEAGVAVLELEAGEAS